MSLQVSCLHPLNCCSRPSQGLPSPSRCLTIVRSRACKPGPQVVEQSPHCAHSLSSQSCLERGHFFEQLCSSFKDAASQGTPPFFAGCATFRDLCWDPSLHGFALHSAQSDQAEYVQFCCCGHGGISLHGLVSFCPSSVHFAPSPEEKTRTGRRRCWNPLPQVVEQADHTVHEPYAQSTSASWLHSGSQASPSFNEPVQAFPPHCGYCWTTRCRVRTPLHGQADHSDHSSS
mmetsp:Transcript_38169/g.85498  ORF Transcript_38169/g.85498 Transcript_38169/m.85498 type:complete len:231 (-) Transcript_38169:2324-3016(-)